MSDTWDGSQRWVAQAEAGYEAELGFLGVIVPTSCLWWRYVSLNFYSTNVQSWQLDLTTFDWRGLRTNWLIMRHLHSPCVFYFWLMWREWQPSSSVWPFATCQLCTLLRDQSKKYRLVSISFSMVFVNSFLLKRKILIIKLGNNIVDNYLSKILQLQLPFCAFTSMSETVVMIYIHGYHDRLWHFSRIQLPTNSLSNSENKLIIPVMVPATKKIVNNRTHGCGFQTTFWKEHLSTGHLTLAPFTIQLSQF